MQDSIFAQNRTAINAIIDASHDFGIVVGRVHSLDKMAAALSLYLALTDSGKNAQIVSATDPKVDVSNLVGIDKVKRNFDGVISQYVIELPYRENEIEKISYNAEGSKLNINIVGGEQGITFGEQDIKIKKTGSAPSVIFAVGVETQEELNDLVEQNENLKVINIDNSPTNIQYGDIVYASNAFSSISEIVGKLIYESGFVMEQDTAQNLMNGIVASTGNFEHSNTSPTAFEAASYLLRSGAIRQKIKMNEKKDEVRPEFQPKQKSGGQNQNQPKQNSQQENVLKNNQDIPNDWFTPKVFKGSKGQGDQ